MDFSAEGRALLLFAMMGKTLPSEMGSSCLKDAQGLAREQEVNGVSCRDALEGELTASQKPIQLQKQLFQPKEFFGCSWLCCTLHQSPESLCHRTGDLSAGEVSHC